MLITAVDPGPRFSAYVVLHGKAIVERGKIGNHELNKKLREAEPHGPLVVEMIAPYGRIVGRETMESLVWIGRYIEAWRGPARLLERKDVKKALGLKAGGPKAATDADVRAELIARWGGERKKRAKTPVALSGIVDDEWAALAVAVAWREKHGDVFAAVEEAPLSDLEELNRALAAGSEARTAHRRPRFCLSGGLQRQRKWPGVTRSEQQGSGAEEVSDDRALRMEHQRATDAGHSIQQTNHGRALGGHGRDAATSDDAVRCTRGTVSDQVR